MSDVPPRLFIEPDWVDGARRAVRLPREQARYLRSVLRLSAGAEVTLLDGGGLEYGAVLVAVDGSAATAEIVRSAPAAVRGNGVLLAPALTKGAKLDLVVQKATELGAAAVHPVTTRRSVPRVEDGGEARLARWRRIAVEAAEQCERGDLPAIHPVEPLASFLARELPGALKLCLYEGAARGAPGTRTLRDALAGGGRDVRGGMPVVALLGPEGGFDPEEAEAARAAGYQWVGLGPRVLRAETAALAALAVLSYEIEG